MRLSPKKIYYWGVYINRKLRLGGPSGFSSYFLLLPERSSVMLSEGSWCSSSNIIGCSCQAGKARCPRQGVSSRSSNIYKDVLEAKTTYSLWDASPEWWKLDMSNWNTCPCDPVDPGPSRTNTDWWLMSGHTPLIAAAAAGRADTAAAAEDSRGVFRLVSFREWNETLRIKSGNLPTRSRKAMRGMSKPMQRCASNKVQLLLTHGADAKAVYTLPQFHLGDVGRCGFGGNKNEDDADPDADDNWWFMRFHQDSYSYLYSYSHSIFNILTDIHIHVHVHIRIHIADDYDVLDDHHRRVMDLARLWMLQEEELESWPLPINMIGSSRHRQGLFQRDNFWWNLLRTLLRILSISLPGTAKSLCSKRSLKKLSNLKSDSTKTENEFQRRLISLSQRNVYFILPSGKLI